MLQEIHLGKVVFKYNPKSTDNKTKNCVMRLQQTFRSLCTEEKKTSKRVKRQWQNNKNNLLFNAPKS